ncbi:MAG: hypothetical protein K6G87_12960 [Butyrivibrio sp.]|uniref:hypothetical protein n=1 Tax=Butyrivibrio sp. TaxID=28121 RepID=UPI0025F03F8D|nr:hypothetical protein [Butyrivibrio sp.]MCR5772123.1 hypothetical protein [Butyrivibrio sp.]
MNNQKFYYTIYGLTLASDYEFSQFVKLEEEINEPDIEIVYGGIPDFIEPQIKEGYYKGIKEDEMWFYNSAGLFYIHDRKTINFIEYNKGTIDDAAVFLPGLCLAVLLWYRKMLMIHGACLRINDKTIIVAGNSGAGKSTLTTELIKRGALLMADDVTGIILENGQYISYPAFPAQKLCEDQVEKNGLDTTSLKQVRYDLNKFEVSREDDFYDKPAKVDALFRVEVQDVPSLTKSEITGSEKLKIITDCIFINWLFNDTFKFEPDDMLRCIGLSNQISVHKICRNKDQNTLNEILDYIQSNV